MPETYAPSVINIPGGGILFCYRGKGLTSKQDITVEVKYGVPGKGICFFVKNPKNNQIVEIPARAEFVVNTLRNVVLGKDGTRLCIVEHFLAAVALWGLQDLSVYVDGPEIPLGDGSANLWIDLLKRSGIPNRTEAMGGIDLPAPIVITKNDRTLMAVPDTCFSVSYLMDWDHPLIGKRWQTWNIAMPPEEISDARTFGSLKDHQALGLVDQVVSMTADGFTHPLRFEDEPVRHKLLDLVGDLALVGVNPLRINARFISIKGGHEMDVQLARKLAEMLGQ
jgi:UDP-3-O-[3-hydroxymyristoyl] N-acetylglucosamine deacetylase